MTEKLPNYLRTHRKRSGLSQKEVAFLLGCLYGTKVSRYERQSRLPSIETTLALEIILGAPSTLLFEGIYRKIERETRKRAKLLAKELAKEEPSPATYHKLAFLKQIYDPDATLSARRDNKSMYE